MTGYNRLMPRILLAIALLLAQLAPAASPGSYACIGPEGTLRVEDSSGRCGCEAGHDHHAHAALHDHEACCPAHDEVQNLPLGLAGHCVPVEPCDCLHVLLWDGSAVAAKGVSAKLVVTFFAPSNLTEHSSLAALPTATVGLSEHGRSSYLPARMSLVATCSMLRC